MMATISRDRVGRSGHGVSPSVRTTTTSGFGRLDSAAAMPTRMSVPPPPTSCSSSTPTDAGGRANCRVARQHQQPTRSNARGSDHAFDLRQGRFQLWLAHTPGGVDHDRHRHQRPTHGGSHDPRNAASTRPRVGVVAASGGLRNRASDRRGKHPPPGNRRPGQRRLRPALPARGEGTATSTRDVLAHRLRDPPAVMLASAEPIPGAAGSPGASSQSAGGSPAPEPQPLPQFGASSSLLASSA